MDADDVGVVDTAEGHGLVFLDLGQGFEAIAQARGVFKPFIQGRCLHIRLHALHDVLALAVQELHGVLDLFGVVVLCDLAHTRRGAFVDLMQETGARAALERRIIAGSKQKEALKLACGVFHGFPVCEGPEQCVLFLGSSAVFAQLREGVRGAEQYARIAASVFEAYVEGWVVFLDELLFKEEGFVFCVGGDGQHARCFGHHTCQTCVGLHLGVIVDAAAQAFGFANVEGLVVFIEHSVNTGLVVQCFDKFFNDVNAGGRHLCPFFMNMSVFGANAILFCVFQGHVLTMNNDTLSFDFQGAVHPKILRLMVAEMGEDLVQKLLNVDEIDDAALAEPGVPELLVRTYGLFEAARMEMFGGVTKDAREYFVRENMALSGRPVDYHNWPNGDRLLFDTIMRAAYGVYI